MARYDYKNPTPGKANWHSGVAYDVGVSDNMLYTNSTGSMGKMTVFIRERATGKISQRTGISEQIGNFGVIWINWKGKKITAEKLLKLTR